MLKVKLFPLFFFFFSLFQRQIAVDTSTTKTTRNPDFAKQIIKLAFNQTSPPSQQTPPSNADVNQIGKVTSINVNDIEKNKKDVASLNSDLQLLSTLLGRPVSPKDIPQLTKQASSLQPSSSTLRSTTVHSTKTTVIPGLVQESSLLQQIGDNPDDTVPDNDLTSTDELAAIDPSDAYGKTNDALLATLLKQRGIGPAHNNIPLSIYSTTTEPPRIQTPSRSPRPLVDGLAWLWKTWQDTAPGQGGYQPQSTRTRTRGANAEAPAPPPDTTDSDTMDSFDDGLDADISSVCIRKRYRISSALSNMEFDLKVNANYLTVFFSLVLIHFI